MSKYCVANKGLNLVGKKYLVFGGTDGIGKATALILSSKGADVTILGKNSIKGAQACTELQNSAPNKSQKLTYDLIDVHSIAKVKQYCQSFRANNERLDGLILCAGGLNYGPRRLTQESIEVTYCQNYLSRFTIINELVPLLSKTGGRVVHCLAAGQGGKIDVDDMTLSKPSIIPFFVRASQQYASMGDIMIREFAKRYGLGNGITQPKFYHIFPGIVNTNGAKNQGFPGIVTFFGGFIMPLIAKNPVDVGNMIVYIETSEEFGKQEINGSLVSQNGSIVGPSEQVQDSSVSQKVWEYGLSLIDSIKQI